MKRSGVLNKNSDAGLQVNTPVLSYVHSFLPSQAIFPCSYEMDRSVKPLCLSSRSHKVSPAHLTPLYSGSQSARSVLFSQSKHSLLSPVHRTPKQSQTKGKLSKLLRISGPTEKTKKPTKYADLKQGFRLFRELFALGPETRPSPPPVPKVLAVRILPAEKPEPTSKSKLIMPEADTSSLSVLLDLNSGLQTPRRRSSFMQELPVALVEKEQFETKPVERMLTPVIRIQAIDPSELSSSESEESFHFMPSRRDSKTNSIMRRGSGLLPAINEPALRRLTTATETHASLMTDYSQKTASMLGDTQFRIKGFKTQRSIPMRYFKNL